MIIALGYESNTGKSTIANLLFNYIKLEYNKLDVKIVPLARKVKEECHRLFWAYGVRDENYYENNREERERILWNGMNVVDIWIWYSQRMKEFDKLYWVKAQERARVTIVPDMRFMEEIEFYDSYPSFYVKVKSDRVKRKGMDHHLDSYLGWHYEFDNNGTMEDLSRNVKLLYEKIKEKYNFNS